MARIKQVDHVVLGVRDPHRSIDFYTNVLGMECVRFFDDMQMGFLAFGDSRYHDMAVVKVPEDQPVGSSGLSHSAFEIEGGEDELRELYQRLKEHGAQAEVTADHIASKSIYVLDPDGNRLEFFVQVMTADEGKKLLRDVATAMETLKPLDLEPAAV
jgi:catechol 2,3-dioxygenase-like lactoylglutathione lyase family enzyme